MVYNFHKVGRNIYNMSKINALTILPAEAPFKNFINQLNPIYNYIRNNKQFVSIELGLIKEAVAAVQ